MRAPGIIVAGVIAASLAYAEDRHQLVVLSPGSGTIELLDPGSGNSLATIRVGPGPNEVTISKDGRTAVVANYGKTQGGHTLSVIDIARRRLTRTISLRFEHRKPGEPPRTVTYHRPHGLCFTRDQTHVLVTCEAENALLLVDLTEGRVLAAMDTEQKGSCNVILSTDGRKAYVANRNSGSVSVIDLNRRGVEKIIETGGGAQGLALRPKRDELWVTNRNNNSISVVDTKTLKEEEEFPCGAYPVRLVFTPDGKYALCVNKQAGSVTVFLTRNHRVIKEIALGRKSRPVGLAISPDGSRVYVSCSGHDRVIEIDVKSWKIAGTMEGPSVVDAMVWSHFEDDVVSAK